MKAGFVSSNFNDTNGNPDGGSTHGTGFCISWQRGPLGRGDDRQAPNGAFVEDVLGAVLDRLAYYQGTQFQCHENATAIHHIRSALEALDLRTRRRECQQVEGTHRTHHSR